MNRLDKPFKVGDRIVVSQKHYPSLPVGRTGTIFQIPQESWHSNEVSVEWDNGERNILSCVVLEKIEPETKE